MTIFPQSIPFLAPVASTSGWAGIGMNVTATALDYGADYRSKKIINNNNNPSNFLDSMQQLHGTSPFFTGYYSLADQDEEIHEDIYDRHIEHEKLVDFCFRRKTFHVA